MATVLIIEEKRTMAMQDQFAARLAERLPSQMTVSPTSHGAVVSLVHSTEFLPDGEGDLDEAMDELAQVVVSMILNRYQIAIEDWGKEYGWKKPTAKQLAVLRGTLTVGEDFRPTPPSIDDDGNARTPTEAEIVADTV